MKNITYTLQGNLAEQDLKQVHREVLEVLEQIGVECAHEPTLQQIAGIRGIRIVGHRVFFSPDLVNEYIERFRVHKPDTAFHPPSDEIRILSGPWMAAYIEDMETRKIRRATCRDVEDGLKLCQVAGMWARSPVWPSDLPSPLLQLLYLEKRSIELTDSVGSDMEISDPQMLEYIIEMYQAVGRKYVVHVQFPISPLKMNPSALDTIWKLKNRQDIVLRPLAGPIPQAGLTTPIFAPAAIVQEIAESLAGCILIDGMTQGRFVCRPDFRMDLFDMRYAGISGGTPEYFLWQLILSDLCRYFTGRPKRWHTLHTHAKQCDPQALMERTVNILTLAMAGFRDFFFGAGQLSYDQGFSPALFVMDLEIARYATHFIRGLPFETTPGVTLETIREGVREDGYLSHESTLNHFRQFFTSDLFSHSNVEQWQQAGEPDLWKQAVGKAKEMIASYHRPPLPEDQRRDLDRIYQKAVAYVQRQ